MKNIDKLMKLQDECTFKAAPKLTQPIVHPTHFQKMRSYTFENLISIDVIDAMKVLSDDSNTPNSSNNPTCWLFAMLNKWRCLTAYDVINLETHEWMNAMSFLTK